MFADPTYPQLSLIPPVIISQTRCIGVALRMHKKQTCRTALSSFSLSQTKNYHPSSISSVGNYNLIFYRYDELDKVVYNVTRISNQRGWISPYTHWMHSLYYQWHRIISCSNAIPRITKGDVLIKKHPKGKNQYINVTNNSDDDDDVDTIIINHKMSTYFCKVWSSK